MLIIGFFIFGAAMGGLRASRRKGKRADILHYMATHGVIFALIGVMVHVFLLRAA